jgi:sugar-specific transcriptional regulator TrmB
MLIKSELIDKIKDYFGLNIYESKVWLALLGKGVASAGEISEISNVPRSRTYDVLENLEKKGFVIIKIGKPINYIGVRPQIILDRLKNNITKESQEKMNTLSNIKTTEEFSNLENLYVNGISPIKREEISLSLTGKTNISNYLKEILKRAKKEVIICGETEYIKSKIKLFKNTLKNLKESNVSVKFSLFGENDVIKKISELLGVKVKKVNFNSKFFIIDRKEILFYLSKSSEEDSAVWVNSEFFVEAFSRLFETNLKNGK